VSKGTLSGSGPAYTLGISGFTSGGTLNVAVVKLGYTISSSPRTVSIYYSSGGGSGDTAVTFNSITADGSSSQTTTQLTLTFSQAITGLSAADITLSGVSGVSKGTLSGSGPTYTLPISGFTSGGTLNVAVTKSGYTISSSPQTVSIYYSGGSSGNIAANLLGTWQSEPYYVGDELHESEITITFNANDITWGGILSSHNSFTGLIAKDGSIKHTLYGYSVLLYTYEINAEGKLILSSAGYPMYTLVKV